MSFIAFDQGPFSRLILPLAAGLLVVAALRAPAQAADKNTFIIDDTEGYGITECLVGGKTCGRVVADAWCEAHGMGPALAYGKAEDITASIGGKDEKSQKAPAPSSLSAAARSGSVVVQCKD